MPTKQFAFEANGPKRLQLSWGPFRWSDFNVSVDGAELGTCTAREFRSGCEFSLPDATRLYTRFTMSGVDVRRDGKALPGAALDPHVMFKSAYLTVLWVGGGNLLVGALSLLNEELRDALGWPTLLLGGVFLALGPYVKRESKGALIGAVSIAGLLSVGLVLGLPRTLPGIPLTAWVLAVMTRPLRGLPQIDGQPAVGKIVSSTFTEGVKLLDAGNPRAALEEFQLGLSRPSLTNEQKGDALYNIAICHIRLGNHDAAIAAVTQAVTADPALAEEIKRDEDFAPLLANSSFHEATRVGLAQRGRP